MPSSTALTTGTNTDREPLSWRALRASMFALDAEQAHRLAMTGLRSVSRICRVDLPDSDVARAQSLRREVLGLTFPNPLGLAAGFDKDGEALPAWQALGFGFIEIGTVTRHAQPGNDKPRLFRLKDDRALLNRLGFNNHGADAAARAVQRWRKLDRVRVPLGINLGKSKISEAAQAPADYAYSFAAVADLADYVVINVSSPNTPGLRDLQKRDELSRILLPLAEHNAARGKARPIVVKLAPDLDDDDARACAEVAVQSGVQGLVISNTTISRAGLRGAAPDGSGGISGRPLFARSTALLRLLADEYRGKLTFIGVGGIEDGATAQAKLDAGASLLQAYTGFIYGGPGWPRRLLAALAHPPK